jgi:hypothetical protein
MFVSSIGGRRSRWGHDAPRGSIRVTVQALPGSTRWDCPFQPPGPNRRHFLGIGLAERDEVPELILDYFVGDGRGFDALQ